MEVSAIKGSPKIERKSNARREVATSTLSGIGIGALVNGAESLIKQKAILKNPDTFLKTISEEIEANADNPELQAKGKELLQGIKDFVAKGKIDKKMVLNNALKGALSVGVLFGAITLASHLIKNIRAKKSSNNSAQKA